MTTVAIQILPLRWQLCQESAEIAKTDKLDLLHCQGLTDNRIAQGPQFGLALGGVA
jgi:hypothetical protein